MTGRVNLDDPTDAEIEDARRRIVEAAWELGCAEGEPAVTMRRIAERVGISATGLYTHFYDKAALVRELLVLADARLDATLASAGESDSDPVYVLCMRHVTFVREHRWLFGVAPARDSSASLADDAFVRRACELLCDTRGCDATEGLRDAKHLRVALEGIAWTSMRAARDGETWTAFADGYVRFLVGALG
jgi:AcrR family transcriptional regulator